VNNSDIKQRPHAKLNVFKTITYFYGEMLGIQAQISLFASNYGANSEHYLAMMTPQLE
jgi:hypothetical protein